MLPFYRIEMERRMHTLLSTQLWPRVLILTWLTAWMLAIPLVHVHPEVDHHHGQPGHVHGGVSHAVFSSDLPCEYGSNHERDVDSSHHANRHGSLIGSSAHFGDHPELAFSFLTSSPERGLGKPAVVHLLSLGTEDFCLHLPTIFVSELSYEPLKSVVLSFGLSSRAPPLSAV